MSISRHIDRPESAFADRAAPDDHCPEQHLYGRLAGVITPEVKARADAEWLAMDWRGRLPKGWTYSPQDEGREG